MDILPAISMEPDDTDVYANSRSLIMAEENSYSQQQQQQVSRDLNNSTTNNYTGTTRLLHHHNAIAAGPNIAITKGWNSRWLEVLNES